MNGVLIASRWGNLNTIKLIKSNGELADWCVRCGMMEGVVKVVKAGLNEQLVGVATVFGTTTRLSIMGYLRRNGPAQTGTIAKDLNVSRTTVAAALLALEELGAIVGDSPADQRHGKRVMYSANDDLVVELVTALAHELNISSIPPSSPGSLEVGLDK